MCRARSVRPAFWCVLAACALVLTTGFRGALGQDDSPTAKPAVGASGDRAPAGQAAKPAAKKPQAFHGRLPAYYSKVVDETQREKIYAVQIEYKPKIDALKAQLAQLTAERDAKVAAVLTDEQRAKVEQLKADAAKARAAKKSAKPATAAK